MLRCGRSARRSVITDAIRYDYNGNTATRTDSTGTTSYVWDFENRLTSVSLSGGGTVYFKYDPFGRRIGASTSPHLQVPRSTGTIQSETV